MKRSIAVAALLWASAGTAVAQPTATFITPGFTFVDWLTVNNQTVGVGDIDVSNVVYYLKEKQLGNLQSWLIFFDPLGNQSVRGSVTFGGPIAALFTSSADVTVTSAAYQLTPTVSYGVHANTGLESGDNATFAGNVMMFDWTAADPGDHVRVLTTVPEPSSYALLAGGLGALALISRRRRIRCGSVQLP